jgi:hypothetical protein
MTILPNKRLLFSKSFRRKCYGLLVGCLLIPTIFAQVREPTEFELKAALLYNFALFTEWPVLPNDTFNLCLYGPDPFGAAIEVLAQRTLLDRRIQIQRPRQPKDISACHLLYISSPALPELAQLLALTRNQPILTIADRLDSGDSHAVINLGLEQRRIIFDIDLAAANRAGLRLSSKLLRLAHDVQQ